MKTVFHINRLPFAERVCDKEGVHHHIYIYIHTYRDASLFFAGNAYRYYYRVQKALS